MLWIVAAILSLLSCAGSRPTNNTNAVGEKLCRVGNISLPVPVFESYAGWECYEETYGGMKELTVQVCVEEAGDSNFSVPCFKVANGKPLSFNLKNEETVLAILEASGSRELNDEMIRCYLSIVTACETSQDGWLAFHGGHRSFVSNTTKVCSLEGQSKFHIAMLSISLIIGIPIVFIFFWAAAAESLLVFHSRNLVLALIARTLFSLLIETEVISEIVQAQGEPIINWAGCEALALFETVALNLVLAFWLILNFYLFEYSKTNFQKKPDIRKGSYIVSGLAVTFPIIWVIIMGAGGYGNCWLERTPVQWVNDALRLGFILLQFVLTSAVCFRVVTEFHEPTNAQTKLRANAALFTLLLSPVFLLQFSLSASHPVEEDGDPHIYTEFFFDGLQCAIVSSVILLMVLFMFPDFVLNWLSSFRGRKCDRVFETMGSTEMEIRHGDDPPRVPRFPSPPTNIDDEERKDVTYTSVLTPERFERTIKLYNRLNIIPKQEASEEALPDDSSVKSEYFDVDNESVNTVYKDVFDPNPEGTKNRYYNSRYLVDDSESSVSEESVLEVISQVTQQLPSSSSSSSVALPPAEIDTSREIEKWLASCQSEFQDYAEKAIRNKLAIPKQNIIHRSLSGNILSGSEIPGSVKVQLSKTPKSEPVRVKKYSAPSRISFEGNDEGMTKKKEELPSIYDDLKEYPRLRSTQPSRKRDHGADWSSYRNRILDKRRKVKSLDDVDASKPADDGMSPQLKALLWCSCDNEDLRGSSLQKNHFSGMEDLTQLGDDMARDTRTNTGISDDREQKKTHFANERQLPDVIHVQI